LKTTQYYSLMFGHQAARGYLCYANNVHASWREPLCIHFVIMVPGTNKFYLP